MMRADTPSIQKDQDVYDANHEHVGRVDELAETWMHVQSGFFGWVKHHVPLGLVSHVDDDGVHLTVAKDQLEAVDEQADHDGPNTTESVGSEVASDESARTVLHEEQLQATTREVESGEVAVQKDVVEEEQTVAVPVTHEEVHVERHPVDASTASAEPIGTEGETLRVPVSHEEVEVTKRTVPTEEVVVEKTPVTETQEVTETVQREEATVDHDEAREGGTKWT